MIIEPVKKETDELQQTIQYLHEELENTNKGMLLLTLDLEYAAEKYRNIFENAEEGIYQCTNDGRYILLNPSMARILGYQTIEDVFLNISNIQTQVYKDTEKFPQIINLINNQGKISRIESEIITRDNSTKWISENIHELLNSSGQQIGIEGIVQDITITKKAQDTLLLNELRFRNILGSIPIAVVLINDKNLIEEWNLFAEQTFGYKKDTVLGKDFFDLLFSNKAKHEIVNDFLNLIDSMNHKSITTPALKSNGTNIICEWNAIQFENISKNCCDTIIIAKDITNKLKMQEFLSQHQKMEALGNLSRGIAHDFNNVLMIIKGYAELAKNSELMQPQLKELMQNILDASTHANKLIDQLVDLSRNHPKMLVKINLNDLITNLMNNVLRSLISTEISIELKLNKLVDYISGDPNQITQIIVNLVINAKDAIDECSSECREKKIIISTENICIDANFSQNKVMNSIGNHVLVKISDTGVGMKKEVLKRLFEPFFTTKENRGTGLGLSLVYSIVTQHKGTIYVESEQGIGTEFYIYFPTETSLKQDTT